MCRHVLPFTGRLTRGKPSLIPFFGPAALGVALAAKPSTELAASWIAAQCARPSGAITVRPGGSEVSGYFGSLTADALARSGTRPEVVLAWMSWYVAHAHDSGSGVDGVADDVELRDGTELSRGRPDSTDAYGALFMTLARDAYDSGDPTLRAFVLEHRAGLTRIAESSIATLQPIGLTWASPQHRVFYAIDNAQVVRGMRDAAVLMRTAYADTTAAQRYDAIAARVDDAMRTRLWDARTQTFRPYLTARDEPPGANLGFLYPDALAQLFAIYDGIVPNDGTAQSLAVRASRAVLSQADPMSEAHLLLLVVQRRLGIREPLPPFTAPALCADAAWYISAARS